MNMKKTNRMLIFAACFVAGLLMTACSTTDDAEGEELEQGVVKAEFTISFPKQMGSFTRQGIDIVQGQPTPVFRGLQNIKLRPFHVVAENVDKNTQLSTKIVLKDGNPSVVTDILGEDALYETSNSHLYQDIEVPIGTRSFLFYGEAKDKAGSTTTTQSQFTVNGTLNCLDTGSKLDEVEFTQQQIYTGDTNGEATEIAKYLSNILNAGVGTETTLTLFPNLTEVKTGSWNSVKAVAQQIYKAVYKQVATGNLQEAIVNAILKQDWGSGTTPDWKTFATENKDNEDKPTGELTFSASYTYPQNIGLPDGAAYINWNSTNKEFEVISNDNMGMNIATLDKYVYPASLYYYGLSNIITANETMENSYKNSANDWSAILTAYGATEGSSNVVQSTTRSIAIEKKMQYAVGRLDVTVTTKNGTSAINDNKDKSISITATTFPITGIIVGNQRAVNYKFETKKSALQYTVYDSQVYNVSGTDNAYMYPGSIDHTKKTRTLVLETLDAGESGLSEADYNVPIAVEFLNTSGESFVGMNNNIIYPNTKFYLIGTLTPATNVEHKYDVNDERHYDTNSSASNLIKKAFVQDYVTTANFVVANLKKAYNLLPDLRTPNLEIGMSVDLNWNNGITQTITIE